MIRFDDILDLATPYLNEKDILVLQKAYVFAGRAHKGQTRRSGEPYLSHLLEVTYYLAEQRLDRTTLVAALLHDVLEDTEVTAAEIKENFGKEAADLVEGVTKISRVHGASPEADRAETIRKIILAMTDDIRVIFIKLADRVHNLKTLKFLKPEQQEQIARETLDIYAPIANRLGMGRTRAELEDLSFKYVTPDAYNEINRLISPLRNEAENDLAEMKSELARMLAANGIPGSIESRIKRPYSISAKIKRQNIGFDQVYDLLALRIVTDTVKNCYAILGLIHQQWTHMPQRFRDYIAMPKANLYQSLHTTIITKAGKKFEIQIRTTEMNDLAENGIAAHWRYKDDSPANRFLEDRRLHWLREMAALYEEQKNPRDFLRSLKANLVPEELYVFTPKGKVVPLPPGATALDFAFKIHSEIGLHAAGAIINAHPSPLKTALETGDIVEILTAPEKIPSRSWLAAVATSNARQQIRRWLNLKSRSTAVELGRKIWEKELSRTTLPSEALKEQALLARLEEVLGTKFASLDEFHRQAGLGRVVIDRTLIQALFPNLKPLPKSKAILRKAADIVIHKPGGGIRVSSLEEPMMKLAKCCSPVKGEPVVGYITAGKGITVHAARCWMITKELLDPHRLVEVDWDQSLKGVFTARLLIRSEDSPGVLAAVAAAVADLDGNIIRAEARALAEGKARINLTLQVKDIRHLETIKDKLDGLKLVSAVERI